MLIVNERARAPYLRKIGTYTCLTIKSDVYEAFVNPEESFREGPFYAQIIRNLLIYLRMFHE